MKTLRKACAALAASMMLLTLGAQVASASPEDQVVSAQDLKTIDKDKPGSLTIHKFKKDKPTDVPAPGTKLDDTSHLGEPLKGVNFSVQQVKDVDLSTREGWQKAENISKDPAGARRDLSKDGLADKKTQTTGDNGQAAFTNLAVGLYYVEEDVPLGATPAEPFFVTIPLTDPVKHQWNYDVHVYPKNNFDTPLKKTVVDGGKNVGDKVTYKIQARSTSWKKTEGLIVTDTYPTKGLKFERVTSAKVGEKSLEVSQLKVEDKAGQADHSTVSVDFAQALDALNALDQDKRIVEVELKFTLVANETDHPTKAIENKAGLYNWGDGGEKPDDPYVPGEDQPGVPDEPGTGPKYPWPKTFLGNVTLTKKASDETGLVGVTFELTQCTKDAQGKVKVGDKITLNGKSEFTTESGGKLTIRGLHANNYADGAPVEDGGGYCFVETKTLKDYELLAEPIFFTVNADLENDYVALVQLDNVVNVRTNAGFVLPFTGGTGVWITIGTGLAIAVLGGSYHYMSRRRQH